MMGTWDFAPWAKEHFWVWPMGQGTCLIFGFAQGGQRVKGSKGKRQRARGQKGEKGKGTRQRQQAKGTGCKNVFSFAI